MVWLISAGTNMIKTCVFGSLPFCFRSILCLFATADSSELRLFYKTINKSILRKPPKKVHFTSWQFEKSPNEHGIQQTCAKTKRNKPKKYFSHHRAVYTDTGSLVGCKLAVMICFWWEVQIRPIRLLLTSAQSRWRATKDQQYHDYSSVQSLSVLPPSVRPAPSSTPAVFQSQYRTTSLAWLVIFFLAAKAQEDQGAFTELFHAGASLPWSSCHSEAFNST